MVRKKYNVSSLEELGLERLQKEEIFFKNKRNTGSVLAVMGLTLGTAGVLIVHDNIICFGNCDPYAIREGEIITFVGLGMFLTGGIIWVNNGSKRKEIRKAINKIELNVKSLTSFDFVLNRQLVPGLSVKFQLY